MAENQTGADGTGELTPPYIPFATFKNFIGELKQNVVPSRIDSGAMRTKSGSDQSGIRAAMKFFRLTDAQDNVQNSLRLVVDSHGDDEWPTVIGALVKRYYGPIVHDLDLSNSTTPQLVERFRERARVGGSTLEKSIRFYLSAMDEAGMPYSPFLKPPQRPKVQARARKKPSTALTTAQEVIATVVEEPPPIGWKLHPFHLPTRTEPIRVLAPDDLSEAEWSMVNTFMQGYIALRKQ